MRKLLLLCGSAAMLLAVGMCSLRSHPDITSVYLTRYGETSCCAVENICSGKQDTCTGDNPCFGSGSCSGQGQTTLTYYHSKQSCDADGKDKEGACNDPQTYNGLETYKCKCSWGECKHSDASWQQCKGSDGENQDYIPGCGV